MMGAIAGDIIGSPYEFSKKVIEDSPLFLFASRFTDDTVMTVAVAECLLENKAYTMPFKWYGRRFPKAGYGGNFARWIVSDDMEPYGSFGNGSAMRVSPVAWAFETLGEVMEEAKQTAIVTHDHSEGIKGAVATAGAIFLARTTKDKAKIKEFIADEIGYNMDRTVAEIRPNYRFDVTCQGSVPEAIIAFLEAESCEQSVRNAISLGGDADTQACIAGGIAEAFFGLPDEIYLGAWSRLPESLQSVVRRFEERYGLEFPQETALLIPYREII